MSTSGKMNLGWLGYALCFAVGAIVAWMLIADPLHLGGSDDRPEVAVEDPAMWTCPMHPHVLQEEPGQCPVCGMNLVAVETAEEAPAPDDTSRILYYRNPMDPTVTSPVPAKDQMGMDYVPVYADGAEEVAGESTTVRISPTVVQSMNVRSEVVERGDLAREIRTVGYLEYDQERMVSVTTKYSGWVETVYANYVGEPVEAGQPLFEIYSPELVQTQQELLSAREYVERLDGAPAEARNRALALVEAARTRLSYWDISALQVHEMETTGELFRTLQVVAPSSGVIMMRARGLEGMAVSPGTELFHIADLSTLWLSVEIFENQVAWIDVGTPADVSFTYFPGEAFRGTVRFVEPEFSERTRTLSVKLEVPNPTGRLRSGMFATVVFQPLASEQVLTVPSLAVLRTGQRNVVIVDLGEGSFTPREVVLGHEAGGRVEVRAGLEEGERVVTSSQFLLDSEASLQEAVQKMISQQSHSGSH